MSEEKENEIENSKLAYTIIQSLLNANEALSDLLVVMSHAMDEDVIKAITNTGEWESYLESKRNLEVTKGQIETYTSYLSEMENSSS